MDSPRQSVLASEHGHPLLQKHTSVLTLTPNNSNIPTQNTQWMTWNPYNESNTTLTLTQKDKVISSDNDLNGTSNGIVIKLTEHDPQISAQTDVNKQQSSPIEEEKITIERLELEQREQANIALRQRIIALETELSSFRDMEQMIKDEIAKQTVPNRNRGKDLSYDDEEGDGYDTDHKSNRKKKNSKRNKGKIRKKHVETKEIGTQTEEDPGFWQKLLLSMQCVPNPNTE